MEVMLSAQNPHFRRWRKLTGSHGRKKEGAYLVESHKLVVEALLSGAPLEALLWNRSQQKELEGAFWALLEARAGAFPSGAGDRAREIRAKSLLLAPGRFQKLSLMTHSDGLIAVCSGTLDQEVKDPLGPCLILDRIQDPGNLGALFRSAEAFGYDTIFLIDCCDPCNPKALRAAMGASFRLHLVALSEEDWLAYQGKRRLTLYGADMVGEDYRKIRPPKGSFGLLIGNEGQGIRPRLQEGIDGRISIPMKGSVESLNAAISAAILMAHFSAESPS